MSTFSQIRRAEKRIKEVRAIVSTWDTLPDRLVLNIILEQAQSAAFAAERALIDANVEAGREKEVEACAAAVIATKGVVDMLLIAMGREPEDEPQL